MKAAQLGLRHPTRAVPVAFMAAIALGTLLLMLPAATRGGDSAPVLVALFTATSAVCVTGLIVVDTATYWSPFGQGVILALFQLGGLGIMTAASLLGLLLSRRLRLRSRLTLKEETHGVSMGELKRLLATIALVTLCVEVTLATGLALRLHLGHGVGVPEAIWHGAFHAVSAFNNAGFSTYSDSLAGLAGDAWILLPVALVVVAGGLGFPVLAELYRRRARLARCSAHTRMTLAGTAVLLAIGALLIGAYEWNNPRTLGAMGAGGKALSALFHSVMPRTAGFNSIDVGAMHTETLLVNCLLMFIGGGSAGTAGGVKIVTIWVLLAAVVSEVRGEPDVTSYRRRFTPQVERQALAVVMLGLGLVFAGTLVLLSVTDMGLVHALFEATSAFGTVGLSTGVTASLPPAGSLTLCALMYLGRVGTITVASALALRLARRPYRFPQERPLIG